VTRLKSFLRIFTLLLAVAFLVSCNGKSLKSGMLILTEAPEISGDIDYSQGFM
jgi:hypothetical protein